MKESPPDSRPYPHGSLQHTILVVRPRIRQGRRGGFRDCRKITERPQPLRTTSDRTRARVAPQQPAARSKPPLFIFLNPLRGEAHAAPASVLSTASAWESGQIAQMA